MHHSRSEICNPHVLCGEISADVLCGEMCLNEQQQNTMDCMCRWNKELLCTHKESWDFLCKHYQNQILLSEHYERTD